MIFLQLLTLSVECAVQRVMVMAGSFTPATLNANVGDIVTFSFMAAGTATQTATSAATDCAPVGWVTVVLIKDSHVLAAGASFNATMTVAGPVYYTSTSNCAVMRGTITVSAAVPIIPPSKVWNMVVGANESVTFGSPNTQIHVGETINFLFASKTHSVSQVENATSCIKAMNGFDSGNVNALGSYNRTFNDIGRIFYASLTSNDCQSGMRGMVAVLPLAASLNNTVTAWPVCGAGQSVSDINVSPSSDNTTFTTNAICAKSSATGLASTVFVAVLATLFALAT